MITVSAILRMGACTADSVGLKKGDSEIWHYRRTGGKAPPLSGASFGAMAKADAEPPAAKTGRQAFGALG